MELEQDDIVLCTVDRIVGTTVFVKINSTGQEGSIVFSEVAPGRIRNIRNHVVPKKTIVCKILKISNGHIQLSLRRVKEKEKKEAIEQHKLEKSYRAILKSILKEKTPETIEKIKEESTLYEFLEEAKENPKKLEKLVGKEKSEKIIEILKTQKKKTITINKKINLSSSDPQGIEKIKEILQEKDGEKIRYLAAGKYSLSLEGNDAKKTDLTLKKRIEEIEKKAKEEEINFSQN